MNRKDFLKNCLASGIIYSLSRSAYSNELIASPAFREELPFEGIKAIDAHAHPYHLNAYPNLLQERIKHLRSTATIERMKDAGLVASVFAAVGDRWVSDDPSNNSFEDTLDQLKIVENFEEKKKLHILRNKSDLNFSEVKDELFGAIMAIEGGDALEGELSNLNKFHDHGVRLIALLHKHNNEIGFNQESQIDGPLTPFGIKVVEKMNEIDMMIDLAHTKTKTLIHISEVSQLPLLDSHTAPFPDGEANTFPNRARNWEEMEIIAKSGGVICTMPIGYKLGNYSRTTLTQWANEIVLMKTRLGIEHIGLGTDGGGLPRLVDGWDSISSLPNFINELIAVGLSKEDIIAFTGGNFLRIARECLH
jgi:membrane dipeptidase